MRSHKRKNTKLIYQQEFEGTQKWWGLISNLTEEDTFAIRSEFAGIDRECKMGYYCVGGKDGEVISSRLVPGFYLPYDDYRVYRH